jgi:hypothetical protein
VECWSAAVTLRAERKRDKSSTSSKGRRRYRLATGNEYRGAKTASSASDDRFCVLDWGNGVGRERACRVLRVQSGPLLYWYYPPTVRRHVTSLNSHRLSRSGLISVVEGERKVSRATTCRVCTSWSCLGSIEQRGWEGYRTLLAKDGGVAIQDEAAARITACFSVLATVMRQDSQKKSNTTLDGT